MGPQPLGAGQASGTATVLVCIESFFYDQDGTTMQMTAGSPVDPSHPAVQLAPERFADASTATYVVVK